MVADNPSSSEKPESAPAVVFPLVATPRRSVQLKHFALMALCAVFLVLFAYDGFIGWPRSNEANIQDFKKSPDVSDPRYRDDFANWKGWDKSTEDERDNMSNVITKNNLNSRFKWHSPNDIMWQKIISGFLVAVTGLSVWWFVYTQRRRISCTETHLSPVRAVSIPWSAISLVDNTKWEKSGIVKVTYKDSDGDEHTEALDDYYMDHLRPILHELAARADKAEFIPKPQEPTQPASAEGP